MKSDELRAFDFALVHPGSEGRSVEQSSPRRQSMHVRWASLPKPDHQYGTVTYTPQQPLEPRRACGSAYSGPVKRRSSTATELPRNPPSREGRRPIPAPKIKVVFDEVKWQEDPHPGSRVIVNVYEGESVSPRSSTMEMPLWSTDVDYRFFRERVQPVRGTGRRKAGMKARPVKDKTAKRAEDDEDGEGCRIQ